jgi:hypothetical protein
MTPFQAVSRPFTSEWRDDLAGRAAGVSDLRKSLYREGADQHE